MGKIFGLLEYNCLSCGHHWQYDKPTKPLECPKCHSQYWKIIQDPKIVKKDIITEEIESIIQSKSEDLTVLANQLGELNLAAVIKQIKTSFENRNWEQMEESINLLDKMTQRLKVRINSNQREN